jgi:glycosyltransferase involved in cell wall biosynthesis
MPLVSVIIPTTRRHDLVQRALKSVFAQTHRELEVIVVVDGPNPETVTILREIDDPRLRVLENPASLGAGGARNRAAAESRGEYLAFLDDDDEWLPEKIERQLAAALAGGADVGLVSCRSRVMTPKGTYIWPQRLYDPAMPVDEYLFDRRTLFRGDAHVGTSSYFVPRAVFEASRFGDSRQNEDTTLLLRITKPLGKRIVMIPDVLVVLYKEEERESLGSNFSWREMLGWVDSMGGLITRRAYSGFCLIYLGSQAARRFDLGGFCVLLWRAFRRGSPTALQLGAFLTFWLLPAGLRQSMRAWVGGARKKPAAA